MNHYESSPEETWVFRIVDWGGEIVEGEFSSQKELLQHINIPASDWHKIEIFRRQPKTIKDLLAHGESEMSRELKLFIRQTCMIDYSSEIMKSNLGAPMYEFIDRFIIWSCEREQRGLSNLCPLDSEKVRSGMAALGFRVGSSVAYAENNYIGIRFRY